MLQRPFRYRCSLMYAAVCDISYTAESVVLGEGKRLSNRNVGLKYMVWLLDKDDVYNVLSPIIFGLTPLLIALTIGEET